MPWKQLQSRDHYKTQWKSLKDTTEISGLTSKLQALHGDLVDVHGSTHVILPDFCVNAQVSNVKEQER